MVPVDTSSLGHTYQANGQISQAVGILVHVVNIKKTLAENHPGRLAPDQREL